MAIFLQGGVVGALDAECNVGWVCPRMDDEVLFELLLVAVVEEVDARIHSVIAHLGINGNLCLPLRWISPDESVDGCGGFVDAVDNWRWVGIKDVEVDDLFR